MVTAVVTCIVGRIAGAYISSYGVGSAYGAAGSIIALLLWIYNCALFFVFGAVFTAVWAKHKGREIEPLKHAVRVIVSERNNPLRQDPGTIWRALRWLLYRLADRVTANTRQALNAMAPYVSAHKLAFVPNPVQLPVKKAQPAESFTVLNVGRLVPQKGQRLILDALTRIDAADVDWRMVIVGDGPLAGELSAEDAMKSIEDGWNETTDEIGRDEQLAAYKSTLGAQ